MTRIERIIKEYFEPFNGTVTNGDLDYVMEWVKKIIARKGVEK